MNQGFQQAWKIFLKSRNDVPAYKKFLIKMRWRLAKHDQAIEIFGHIPVTDKKNYIQAFGLKSLLNNGRKASQICASSGSSGAPLFG